MADGRVVIDSYLDPSGAEKGIQDLQRSMESAGKKIGNVGKTLTKTVTAPILGIASAAVWTGAGFEEQMSRVQAISGATGDDLQALEDIAREMGRETRFSASESAEALEYMALAGWETQEMIDALPGVLNLAAAGALDLGQASDIVTDMMSVFGMEADRAGEAADIFAYAQESANLSVEQLGEGLGKVGPNAAAAGMDLAQTSAVLGVFADNNLKGSRAGTVMDAMLRDIRNSAEDGAIAIGDTSVAVYDAEGNMRSMADIMADVESATDGMTGQQRDQALASVFQQQAMQGANIILGEGTDRLYELEDGLYASEGAAQEASDTMEDNLMGALRELKAAFEDLMIDVFKVLEPYIRDFVEWVTDLARAFGNLDDQTKIIIMAIAGIAAAIGPVLVGIALFIKVIATIAPVVGAIVGGVGALIGGLGSLGAMFAAFTGPVGIIVAAIAGLIAVGVQLYRNWDVVKERFEIAMSAFQPLIDTTKQAFQTFLDSLQLIWESLKGLFESLLPVLTAIGIAVGGTLVAAFGVAISIFNAVVSAIGPIINAFINLFDVVVNVFNAIFALIMGDFSLAMEFWNQATESGIEFFLSLWEGVVNFFVTFVQTIIDFFYGLYETLVGNSIIPDMVNAIVEWFQNMFGWLIDIVVSIVEGVKEYFQIIRDTIESYITMALDILKSIWSYIEDTFKNALDFLVSLVTGDFQGMKDAIQNQMENAKRLLERIWNSIDRFFSNILGDIWDTVKQKFQDMVDSVRERMNSVKETAEDIWNEVQSFFEGIDLFQIGKDIIQGLWDGIKNMAGTLKRNIESFIEDNIPGPVKKVLDIMSPSRVMEGLGEDTGEGFEVGLDNKVKGVARRGQELAQAAIPRIETATAQSAPDAARVARSSGTGLFDGRVVSLLEKIANSNQVVVLDTGELVGGTYREIDRVGGSQLELTERWGRG